MEYNQTQNGYFIRLFINEKVNETLKNFALKKEIPAAFISGLGALKNSELGFYHLSKKEYDRKLFTHEMELVSLTGNISWLESEPIIHTHVALGDTDFKLYGGHLFEGECAVTVELSLQVYHEKVKRKMNDEVGLNLLQLGSCNINNIK